MSEHLENKGRGGFAARRRRARRIALCGASLCIAGVAKADPVVSCGGFAMLGGAQMNCSHTVPKAPTQFCTFSWALMTTAGTLSTVQGSFILQPGVSNMMVYQAGGFSGVLSNPIVLCQGKKSR